MIVHAVISTIATKTLCGINTKFVEKSDRWHKVSCGQCLAGNANVHFAEQDVTHFRYQWYGHTLCGIECGPKSPVNPPFTHEMGRAITCDACRDQYYRNLRDELHSAELNMSNAQTRFRNAAHDYEQFQAIEWRDDYEHPIE